MTYLYLHSSYYNAPHTQKVNKNLNSTPDLSFLRDGETAEPKKVHMKGHHLFPYISMAIIITVTYRDYLTFPL